ncbi:acyltransferase family protein [Nocardia sp. alder85J]|uniref:acyltransferase family protein n=1 Tax=Nocardia sp. alder85J TaxID=2862949 RepID=UPI001CD318A0|nr:SGNH hydrolase domain-containing protein [Nocardia sp. alder85J]MCX4097583.1 SGNH hydrolase domain-containing protein [Nocardia sp. alder85J]
MNNPLAIAKRKAASTTPGPAAPDARRGDLDGLRGLAIALVVVFHIWLRRVSGGVDVFLVLSGYFFTGLLLRQADRSGAVAVLPVVRRTVRRLVPALVVVLAAVLVATVLLRPYTQWSDIAGQTLASLFYYQNWRLAWTWSDYLAADPSVSPLQHLWSMSVQGQFYLAALLVVAAVVWACRAPRVRPVLAVLVTAAAAVSFWYAWRGTAHQGWNYYDSAARAWELLAGAGLALVPLTAGRRSAVRTAGRRSAVRTAGRGLAFPAPLLRGLRAGAAVLGLAGVVGCGWLVTDGVQHFPGPVALLPVGATMVLIVAGFGAGPRPWPSRLLAAAPMRRLGDVAYPLYLWHWPILIVVLAERDHPAADLVDGLLVLAASAVLAWATHRWIEQPLRTGAAVTTAPVPSAAAVLTAWPPADDRSVADIWPVAEARPRRYPRVAGALVGALAVAVIGVAGAWQITVGWISPPHPPTGLDPMAYPGAEALVSRVQVAPAPMRPTVLEAPAEVPPPTVDGCIADWNTRDLITCVYGDKDADRTLALVGSSHAEHWLPALQILAAQHRFRIVTYLKMGCPLTLSDDVSYKGEPNPDCRDWSREAIDRLGTDRPDWVFTTGTRPRGDTGDETPQDYLDVWSALADRGLDVVAVRDTPWLRRNGVRYKAVDCLARGGGGDDCGIRRADALDPVNPALEPASRFPTVFPIDLTNAVCTPEVCPAIAGNVLVYHDEHHLTATYARTLAPELDRQLKPILGWW